MTFLRKRKSLAGLFAILLLILSVSAHAEPVSVSVGEALQYPNGYGYMTHYFYMDGKLAYCLQPRLGPMPNGSYETTIIGSEGADGYPLLVKVLACGYGGPNDLTATYFPGASDRERYIYTHIAAGYAYMSNAQMGTTAYDMTGLTDEQFEACGLGNFVRAAAGTKYTGTVKIVRVNSYQDIGYLASYNANNPPPQRQYNVSIIKTDGNENALEGAVFGLYSDKNCTKKVATFPETDANGRSSVSVKTANEKLYIKEIKAPYGYVLDTNVYEVTYGKEVVLEISDPQSIGLIKITKTDSKTGNKTQGDASFEGAQFEVYAAEDIVFPDGSVYLKDSLVKTVVTNADGYAEADNLGIGRYYVRETVAPLGYEIDDSVYDAQILYDDGKALVIETNIEIADDVITNNLIIDKYKTGDKNTKLEGAGFSLYPISSLETNSQGNYIFETGKRMILGPNNETILYTNDEGILEIRDIPYGTYILREETAPKNYLKAEDIIVTVLVNDKNNSVQNISVSDDIYKVKARIEKKDTKTKLMIKGPGNDGFRFDLYDETTGHIVESDIVLNDEGFVETSEKLEPGTYRIKEISSKEGYITDETGVVFTVDDSNSLQTDPTTGDLYLPIIYENQKLTGKLTIHKTGRVLHDETDKNVTVTNGYADISLKGIVFGIYSKNDIYSYDGEKDENGNLLKVYSAGEKIAEIITDESGTAVYEDDERPLYEGVYYVLEESEPEGFVKNTKKYEFSVSKKNLNGSVCESNLDIRNESQKYVDSKKPKEPENKPKGRLVLGKTARKSVKNNYRTGDNGNYGYSIILKKDDNTETSKYIRFLIIPVDIILLAVIIMLRRKGK